jgi:hypothetical protein
LLALCKGDERLVPRLGKLICTESCTA